MKLLTILPALIGAAAALPTFSLNPRGMEPGELITVVMYDSDQCKGKITLYGFFKEEDDICYPSLEAYGKSLLVAQMAPGIDYKRGKRPNDCIR